MSPVTTVLVTGANRGIGKGLVKAYLKIPKTTSLRDLEKASGSYLVIIELEVSSTLSIHNAIVSLPSLHNIHALDIVISNAGFGFITPAPIETPTSDIQKHIDTNAYGPFELFKAVAPLLRASKMEKSKFVFISSAGGSLTSMMDLVPIAAYNASKAFGNFLVKWLSMENNDLLIWVQHPGVVPTDMSQAMLEPVRKKGIDISSHVISIEQSVQGMMSVINDATVEGTHGRFLGPDGAEIPW